MTRARAIAAGVLLALAVALVATAAPARERPAELGRMAAEGAVTLVGRRRRRTRSSRPSGLRPGQSVAGNVALANVGESRGRLTLLRTRMVDTPGRFGGRLSDALLLRVEEAGGGSWTGPLAGPDALDLGVMEPGEGRSYRLTLTLPDTGPAGRDNAVQGSSVTIDWAWATESAGRPGHPDPDRHAAGDPRAARPGGAAARDPGRHARSRRCPCAGRRGCTLRIPHQRVLATRGISMYGAATAPCRITFRARIETSPLARASGATLHAPAASSARSAARAGCRARARPSGGSRLRLTPRAVRTLKRTMHHRARVAVVIVARVRGAGGTRTVTRRIVLKRGRAPPPRAGGCRASGAQSGSARRR